MSQLTMSGIVDREKLHSEWGRLCQMGGVVSLLQLACLLLSIAVMTIVGAEPTTAQEYFSALQDDRLVGLLRLDFATLILIALFPLVALAVFAALRRSHPAYAALAATLILTGTLLALANHSAFSIIALGDRYAAAETAVQQSQFLAAGEAIIAGDMWHSTAGFLAGIFMQGGFVFISLIMLRGREFSKWTAYTGLLANGLDLIHVFVGLFAPPLANTLLAIGGIFYLFWFPLLGRDLIRLGRHDGSV